MKAVGTNRRALLSEAQNATKRQRQMLLTLCQDRATMFVKMIPWPALAESWAMDRRAIEAVGATKGNV